MPLTSLINPAEMHQLSAKWRAAQEKIAFVPTMGALHQGHLTLVKEAQTLADRVVVSVFANPLQFGPKEDFQNYPRMLAADREKLAAEGVDALFLPNSADMYPEGFASYVVNESLSDILCGQFRPGHFRGVLTVLAKLFHIVAADFAIFGKKDYQQFHLVKTMVKDLCFPLEVVGSETVRESDGLAMSSRNLRLNDLERSQSPAIFRSMQNLKNNIQNGERNKLKLLEQFAKDLSATPSIKLQYAEIRHLSDLKEAPLMLDHSCILLVAAHLGSVRLIDNLELPLS